jgi:hypothetical protein
MLRKKQILLLPLLLISPGISHGDLSDPSNYDECIVQSMRGVSSDIAARAIIESCRNLFPEQPVTAPPPAAPEAEAAPVETPAPPAAIGTPTQTSRPVAPVPAAPLDSTSARDLSADELARLRVTAKILGSSYRITIDNDDSHLTLTEVTIAVWDESDPRSNRGEYSEAVMIAPRTSATVKYTVHYRGDEMGWRWAVVAARGIAGPSS